MSVQKGSLVAGRYRADRCVGAGGMGEVWEGEHVALGSRVAIKTLLEGGEDNPELVARFRREAKLLGRCRSDHVARVVDFVHDAEIGMVLVMEFVEGRSLASMLESKTMSIDEGLDLAIDLATALADLHRAKIVHRDIKPGNIIMHPLASGMLRAVLVDFGISRLEGHDEENSLTGITRADIALGTVEYMAPEQILNSRQVTAASDVYAVGAILYRALSGRHVFGDRRDEALARAKLIDEPPTLAVGGSDPVAEGLCAVVDRALKKRPALRLASGEQMLELLLPLRALRRETDLDEETTTDGERTLARDLGIADPRASLPSISGAGIAVGASSQRHPEGEAARRSLPGLELPPAVDARPRMGSLAEVAIEPPRPRVPWGTLALAIATAFAVGAAVAVALAPQPEAVSMPATAPSANVASEPASPPVAQPAPCPAEPIDMDAEAVVSATASPAAPPPPKAPPTAPPPAAPFSPKTTTAGPLPPKPPPTAPTYPDPPPAAMGTGSPPAGSNPSGGGTNTGTSPKPPPTVPPTTTAPPATAPPATAPPPPAPPVDSDLL